MEDLNTTQVEILKLFRYNIPERNLIEIKDIISKYLAAQTIESADQDWKNLGFKTADIEQWKIEHRRVNV